MHYMRVQVRFCLGQNEDCCSRDSSSASSEKLFQSGSGGKVNVYDFGEGRVQCNQALTLQEVFCKSRGADVMMKGFSAFLEMRSCRGWGHEISS